MAERMDCYNEKTGEWMYNLAVPETLIQTQTRIDNASHQKSTEQVNIFIAQEYGSFYTLFSKLSSSNLERQNIIRFLYLATFMDYHNKLCLGNQRTDAKYMVFEDFPTVLNLTKVVATKTKNSLIKHHMISVDEDDHIIVNHEYCLKGTISKNMEDATRTRLFENAVRELYERARPSEHKKLDVLVTLLPFINYYHNVVCKCPDAEFIRDIKPYNLVDLCGILHYNPKNIYRLKKDLLDLTVKGEYVVAIIETGKSQTITINPRVYYRKGKMEDLDLLYKYFLMNNK
ncbi:hypothetical protein [Clostridium estertheticum]|uniref:hypothetical protein n=1 Tax=Clostridium estertheticum TaxID=238834 RepID=UPI001C0C775B|nr:hypothetical protein [Clostridium estertheticum]MBU3186632.1 hypothetical protein [Clostridium estertheticum]